MFLAFISNALVSAMQRYFNVALGKKDFQNYKDVFSMSINILLGLSCLILILGESIGLWFVMTRLNIPSDRFEAAIWVYQISLFTFVANTLHSIPCIYYRSWKDVVLCVCKFVWSFCTTWYGILVDDYSRRSSYHVCIAVFGGNSISEHHLYAILS